MEYRNYQNKNDWAQQVFSEQYLSAKALARLCIWVRLGDLFVIFIIRLREIPDILLMFFAIFCLKCPPVYKHAFFSRVVGRCSPSMSPTINASPLIGGILHVLLLHIFTNVKEILKDVTLRIFPDDPRILVTDLWYGMD